MTHALAIEHLTFHYGSRNVLSDVSFDVKQGEIFGLLGRNGSGKSTILSLLSGTSKWQGGSLLFAGRAISNQDVGFKRSLGVVFQNPALDGKLTAKENLNISAMLFGLPSTRARDRIELSLNLAGLSERANDKVSTFSGGMRRRLDIARALLHEPNLVIMDEPTAGLDAVAFTEVWQALEKLRLQTQTTIIIATHRPEEAEKCNRLALLHAGKIAVVASPSELKSKLESDVVLVRGNEPQKLCDLISKSLDVRCSVQGDDLVFATQQGHKLIPRIVEVCPPGSVSSVNLRPASMADVFFKLTGQQLG